MRSLFFASLTFALSTFSATNTTGDTWNFAPTPDTFLDAAVLDLSYLNEDTAGETGFVHLSEDGAGFLRGDGAPIRFWAVNTYVANQGMAALREHARFLAKRGVNMVRFHGQLPRERQSGEVPEEISYDELDRLWQLVAAMRDEGIYVTLSPYYPEAIQDAASQGWPVPEDSPGLAGMLFFDPVLQEAYREWLRETLTTVNPYTGIALRDDPALAIIQMQNEDSLLFWTLNSIQGRELRLLCTLFGEFLEQKYGSLTSARTAWEYAAAPDPISGAVDDWELGIIALSNIWQLTEDAEAGLATTRLNDQAQFLTLAMRDWHSEIASFLREDIGARQLFNAGNWRTADDHVLDDLERYAYTAGDIIGVNRYVSELHEGEYRGWAIVAGDVFREEGLLTRPLDLPIALRQPIGHPYIVSETLWVPPMWQQSEGPVLMAAYQALTGVDISYWFASNHPQWREPQSANGYLPSIGRWVVNTPQQLGAFPAAALIFRLGLIDEAPPAIIEHRELNELWSRAVPIVAFGQGYDPNRDDGTSFRTFFESQTPAAIPISPYSFLAGPILVSFDSSADDYVNPDLEALIDSEARVVTSLTRQLEWHWGEGVVTINAPRAQGAIGAISSQTPIELQNITLESTSNYASILVVSLDNQTIESSERLLVQIASVARPTGWQTEQTRWNEEDALLVTNFGQAPWQIETIEGTLTIQNSLLTRATVLDENGMAVGVQNTVQRDGSLTLQLPPNALYVIIE